MPNPIGLTMPLAKTANSLGVLAFSTKPLEATLFNLKSLILTNWGERPNHFYLGCNLIEFIFSPSNEETKDRIVQRIEQQVAQWLPYVLLNSVVISYSQDGHRTKITVNFSIKGQPDFSSVLEVLVPAGD